MMQKSWMNAASGLFHGVRAWPFPGNVFKQRGTYAAVCGSRGDSAFGGAGLPHSVRYFTERPGAFLVTSPTSGEIHHPGFDDYYQYERRCHIITEDPIEFLHKHKCSIVNQREVGQIRIVSPGCGRPSWDPDVILVGEMRDYETTQQLLPPLRPGAWSLPVAHQ